MHRQRSREKLRHLGVHSVLALRLLALAAGRLLLVGSLLPSTILGAPIPPSQSQTGPPTMAAAGWAQPLAAEPRESISGRNAPAPCTQTVFRHRYQPLLGLVNPQPRLAAAGASRAHEPRVERAAPDPPHLPPAPWRAPPSA